MSPKRFLLVALSFGVGGAGGSCAGDDPKPIFVFSVDARIYSYQPGAGIEAYREHGSGSASVGGTVGLGVSTGEEPYDVQISPRIVDDRLVIDVRSLGPKPERLDVSDLAPHSLPIASDSKGRRYRVNLTPRVSRIDPTVQQVSLASTRLDYLSFSKSPIVLNDSTFVGRMGGGGIVAMVDVCGVADVQFTLHEVPGWESWGVLQDGVITLTHPVEKTVLQISGVRNGPSSSPSSLRGGPYKVWVKWQESEATCEKVWEELKRARDQIASGEFPGGKPALDLLDRQLASNPRPWVFNSGFRSLSGAERTPSRD